MELFTALCTSVLGRRRHENSEVVSFRTQREASDFVRQVRNRNGGPNEDLRRMYHEYRRIRSHAEESTAARSS